MYPRTVINLYRFRYFVAGMLTIALLITLSAIVTTLGSRGLLNSFTDSPTISDSSEDDPNIVTDGVYQISNGIDRVMAATGKGLYSTCKTITVTSSQTGRASIHGGVGLFRPPYFRFTPPAQLFTV
jgi:hypothetical protein